MSMFRDVAMFMRMGGQSFKEPNKAQKQLYFNLIDEEVQELKAAKTPEEELDALIDIIWVACGAINSAGYHGDGAWREVMRSNMSKIDRVTGTVKKDANGKILKPEGWRPPELSRYLVAPNAGLTSRPML